MRLRRNPYGRVTEALRSHFLRNLAFPRVGQGMFVLVQKYIARPDLASLSLIFSMRKGLRPSCGEVGGFWVSVEGLRPPYEVLVCKPLGDSSGAPMPFIYKGVRVT